MWLRKYLTVFKLSWERALEYRTNFIFGRIRDFILLTTFYFLWTTVFSGKAQLFGFNQDRILTYIIGAQFLSTFVLSYAMDYIADSIVSGSFSLLLVKPWGHPLLFYFVNRLAIRSLRLISFLLEFAAFWFIFRPSFFQQTSFKFVAATLVALVLTVLLFALIDFIVGLSAFWTLHAYGPRFALKMALEFTSGRFFPLNILPAFLFKLVNFLPFSFLVFFPLNVYLGRLTPPEVYRGLITQIVWIAVLFVVLKIVWSRGLRRYEAVGG